MQDQRIANGTKKQEDWNTIDWCKTNRLVRNLRQRIFRATQTGDLRKVRSLQKLMLKSNANTLLSIRRVTQINAGKNTAGVDKLIVKTSQARTRLIKQLQMFDVWRAKPTRRIYIPKKNGKLRPLGIPTILDRCMQAKVKNALEPHWEAKFETSSYGFRPGRGCHDAIEAIFVLAAPNKTRKWIVDADIKGAFDNISHEFIIRATNNFPAKGLIKEWLKAGFMEKNQLNETLSGTPQGGVISPLLANIALHGMEEALKVKRTKNGWNRGERAIVRYADDFLVFCNSEEDAVVVKGILENWLSERGLSLSTEKTRIIHITKGFDFLGFNVRQYPVHNTRTGYKLLIKPSKDSVKKIREKLKKKWRELLGNDIETILNQLNPIIRGWANYFRTSVASKVFKDMDYWMFKRQVQFAKRTHPLKSWKWKKQKYWGKFNKKRNDNWVFGNKKTNRYLLKFCEFKIRRHIVVKGSYSPDNPLLKDYWEIRQKTGSWDFTESIRKLAHYQKYKCHVCNQPIFNGEEVHKHHLIPKNKGGEDRIKNIRLVHLYCHKQIHSSKSNEKVVV